jgi:putative ABC transport system permease protein
MIRNLFITAVRSLLKNKFFSAINIFGLSIGMAVFLLLAQYTKFERSYENFVPGKENIYRVKLETFNNGEQILNSAENYPGAGPALKNEIPEVVSFARLYNAGYKNNVIITYKDAKPDPIAFKQKRFQYADSSFLPMMGYEMVKGNAKSALAEPFTCVISETYAKLYFKAEDPIGKILVLQDDDFNNESARVTGVFKDLPENTHMKFDILYSYQTLYNRFEAAPRRYFTGWFRKDMYVFVQLRPGTDPAKVEARFPAIVKKFKPEQQTQASQKDVISLQPLPDIHLKSDLAEEVEPNGNERIVFFMGLIGIFVLVIAWINYVNLSTARALERAKEVGIRKVVGALKTQLINQFLAESAFVNLISVLLAWGLTFLSLSFFNTLSGQALTYSNLVQPWFLLLLAGLWLVSTLLSGFYPAIVLSSFKPVTVLKGKLKNNTRGIVLRKGLVVMQFMASIALIAGTMVVYRQLNYMMDRDLGMSIDQVLVVERPGIMDTSESQRRTNFDVFRNELKQQPSIGAVTTSLTVPGKQREYKVLVKNNNANSTDSTIMRVNSADYDFMEVFRMKVIAGRTFSLDFAKVDTAAVVITESASKLLGFKTPQDAINKQVRIPGFGNWSPFVVGVINDYHQVSLKKPLEPTIFFSDPYGGEFYSVRIKTTNLSQALEHVRKSWSKAFPGNPFDYFFLDDYFNRQYANERKFGRLFTTFAMLAIFIGCLGLFGLSSYTASQRIKEIGIRKVLGASVTDITAMLSRDFIKLVGISVLISTPIAWYVMHNWLQEFAYRTSLSWWIFAVAGLAALFIALITVSYQAIKAALANPVKSLRTE